MQSTFPQLQLSISHTRSQSRRAFVASGLKLAAGAAVVSPLLRANPPAEGVNRKSKICLTPGSIGVSANQTEAIALAERHGFEAVEPYGNQLAALPEQRLLEVVASLKSKGLVWGAGGLPVDFRQDESKFNEDLKALPKIAAALAKAGVSRVGTWLSPAHNTLTYLQNFRQHTHRLREVARVLKDAGLRLGLEYVGTISARSTRRHPFIHSFAETKELIAEIGTGNVGLVLDTWHWWQAGDSLEEIRQLKNEDVVSVDVNDAPVGVAREQQKDGERELPGATGVIGVADFLNALADIGYDGPARAEPFNKALNDLDNEAACAATIKAMRKVFGLTGVRPF